VVFALAFPFTWFSRFCGCVFKVFFGYFIQSKLLSLLFLNRFCGYSCFDLLELSEASRSG
jgi:hypothetical protein